MLKRTLVHSSRDVSFVFSHVLLLYSVNLQLRRLCDQIRNRGAIKGNAFLYMEESSVGGTTSRFCITALGYLVLTDAESHVL